MSTSSWSGTSSRILCKEGPQSRSHRSALWTNHCTRRPQSPRHGSKPSVLPDIMVSRCSFGLPTMLLRKLAEQTSRGAMLSRTPVLAPKTTRLLRIAPTTRTHLSLSSVSSEHPTWLSWLPRKPRHLETQFRVGRGERQALPCFGQSANLPAFRRGFIFIHRNGWGAREKHG